MKFRIFLFFSLIFFSGCSLFDKKTIKIGVIAPFSGTLSGYGDMTLKIMNLSVNDINSADGINGYEIELIPFDGECTQNQGRVGAKKLIEEYGVSYILGGFCSDEMLGAAEISELHNVILFSSGATSSEVTELGDFVFRTVQSDKYRSEELGRRAYMDGYRKIATFIELNEFTFSNRRSFLDGFTEFGGEVILSSSFDSSQSVDYINFFEDLRTSGADSFYFTSQNEELYNRMIKRIRLENITLPIYTTGIIASDVAFDGVEDYLTGGKYPIIDVSRDWDSSKELILRVESLYGEGFLDHYLFVYVTSGYDTVQILADSISNCDDIYDTVCVRDNLYGVKDYNGYTGSITFDEFGDPLYDVSIMEFVNGSVIKLD